MCILESECQEDPFTKIDSGKCRDKGCTSVDGCVACDEEDETKCAKCEDGYIVDARPGSSTYGQCIWEDECVSDLEKAVSGECLMKECASIAECASCDLTTESTCASCAPGFLLNETEGVQIPGQCIQEDECSGALLKKDNGKCVKKACASIRNCTSCESDESQCATCDTGYSPEADGSSCIENTCMQGSTKVENCAECNTTSKLQCSACVPGYALNETTGACDANDCTSLENCTLCAVPEGATVLECIECEAGFLVDQRSTSGLKGTCILSSVCTGVSKPDEEAETCVDKGCAKVEHCGECDSQTEALCINCEDGYTLSGAEDAQVCKKNGLSGGAIAGIVIAVVVVVALVVFLCVWFLVCKKKKEGVAA